MVRQTNAWGSFLPISRYLVSEFREERRLFDQRVVDLGVGTFGPGRVTTVRDDMPLFKVLEVLSTCGVSSVPVVRSCCPDNNNATPAVTPRKEKEGALVGADPNAVVRSQQRDAPASSPPPADDRRVVVDVYCRSYVTYLTKIRPSSIVSVLNSPVGVVLRSRDPEWLAFNARCGENLHTCRKEDTLHAVFTTFAASQVHQLVCVDEEGHCEGIIAIEDIWKWLLE